MDKKMTSEEIAKKVGISQKAVRLYDEKGLLSVKTIVNNGGVYERSFEFQGEMADVYIIKL